MKDTFQGMKNIFGIVGDPFQLCLLINFTIVTSGMLSATSTICKKGDQTALSLSSIILFVLIPTLLKETEQIYANMCIINTTQVPTIH